MFWSALSLQVTAASVPMLVGFLAGTFIGWLFIGERIKINWVLIGILFLVSTVLSTVLLSPATKTNSLIFVVIGFFVSLAATLSALKQVTTSSVSPQELQDDLTASALSSPQTTVAQAGGNDSPIEGNVSPIEVAQVGAIEEPPLTIAEAKRRLAATLGVDISAIKITIES